MFARTQSDDTAITEIDFPNRWFEIRAYYKSHGHLILRSPHFWSIHEPTYATRVEILFKGVHGLKLPAHLHGVHVSIADPKTAERIAREIDSRVHLDQTIYLVRGSHYTGYVMAGVAVVSEDTEEEDAPSVLVPYLRTVFDPGPDDRIVAPRPTSVRRGRRRVDRARRQLPVSGSREADLVGDIRTDLYDIPKLTAGARRLDERGASMDEVLTYLRESGASPIASMAVLHEMTGMTVNEAKSIVWTSSTWADKRADQEAFIAEMEHVLSDDPQPSEED